MINTCGHYRGAQRVLTSPGLLLVRKLGRLLLCSLHRYLKIKMDIAVSVRKDINKTSGEAPLAARWCADTGWLLEPTLEQDETLGEKWKGNTTVVLHPVFLQANRISNRVCRKGQHRHSPRQRGVTHRLDIS